MNTTTATIAVEDIPTPWDHDMGIVVGYEFPTDRPAVVDLLLHDGYRTAETRGARYAYDTRHDVWTIAWYAAR